MPLPKTGVSPVQLPLFIDEDVDMIHGHVQLTSNLIV